MTDTNNNNTWIYKEIKPFTDLDINMGIYLRKIKSQLYKLSVT